MILDTRTDGEQVLWFDLHKTRVEMVDFGVKTRERGTDFRERMRSGLPKENEKMHNL